MFFRKKPKRDAPILHVDDSSFDREILEGEGITVVDFWAAWCSPCRMMEPILDEVALGFEERGVTVAKLDTEQGPETAARFEIRSIPTLIFFRDGEPLFQLTGLVPKPVLERELEELLAAD
ncbi:MAG TPA: thioredoxin [Longimicrobiales bacterium]|nr:thioredoxin [Longimicrobiales bacterium]